VKASKIFRERRQSTPKSVEKTVLEEKQKSLPELKKRVRFSENLFTVFDIDRWINNVEPEPASGDDAEMDSAAEERFKYWQLRWKTHRPFPQSARFISSASVSAKTPCAEDNNLKSSGRRKVKRIVLYNDISCL
jgi:hypothetical protein